jgi:hypothetical protein
VLEDRPPDRVEGVRSPHLICPFVHKTPSPTGFLCATGPMHELLTIHRSAGRWESSASTLLLELDASARGAQTTYRVTVEPLAAMAPPPGFVLTT